jgi:hypothetical protein
LPEPPCDQFSVRDIFIEVKSFIPSGGIKVKRKNALLQTGIGVSGHFLLSRPDPLEEEDEARLLRLPTEPELR